MTPFAWLFFCSTPTSRTNRIRNPFRRRLLSILTVLQTLYAYPVAGSQSQFLQILLLITVVVCVGDSLSWLTDSRRMPERLIPWGRTAATAALAAVALVQVGVVVDRYLYPPVAAIAGPSRRATASRRPRDQGELPLAGSQPPAAVRLFRVLAGLAQPGLRTGIEPLTGLNIDAWIVWFSPGQQEQVVAAISSHPRAGTVYNRALTEFWNPGRKSLEDLPLVRYIFRDFQPVGSSGDYQLMLRKERIATAAVR